MAGSKKPEITPICGCPRLPESTVLCPDEAFHTVAALPLSKGKTVNHRAYRDAEGLSTNSDGPLTGLSIRGAPAGRFSSVDTTTNPVP